MAVELEAYHHPLGSAMTALVKLLQPVNAELSMLLQELGIVMLFNNVQSANALRPIETMFGIFIDVKAVHPENDVKPMFVTVSMFIDFIMGLL